MKLINKKRIKFVRFCDIEYILFTLHSNSMDANEVIVTFNQATIILVVRVTFTVSNVSEEKIEKRKAKA